MNPTVSITKSYARKINLAAYGGKQYESVDFFESRSHAWFDTHPTVEEVDNRGDELYVQCMTSVENQVAKRIQQINATKVGANTKKSGVYCKMGCDGWCDRSCDNCAYCGTDGTMNDKSQ